LGKKLFRVPGTLYHLDHWRGVNSGQNHEFYAKNLEEISKIQKMNREELVNYISGWGWL
jgi:hypothetical protein